MALTLAGELEEAKLTTRQAVEMSPRDPMLWAFTVIHALTHILSEEYEAALDWANRTLLIPNAASYWPHAVRAAALANLDRLDEAKQSLALALQAKPDLSIEFLKKNLPTKRPEGLDPYLDGLKKCGLD